MKARAELRKDGLWTEILSDDGVPVVGVNVTVLSEQSARHWLALRQIAAGTSDAQTVARKALLETRMRLSCVNLAEVAGDLTIVQRRMGRWRPIDPSL